MYTCDYLRLIEIFWIISLPFSVCLYCDDRVIHENR